MRTLLRLTAVIDGILGVVARIGCVAGLMLVVVIVYDVITRYFGFPKMFGFNSTQYQEFEYWLHTVLFSLVIGYAYTRQSHVRIDLVRDRLTRRTKYILEVLGITLLLIPFCLIALNYNLHYVQASYSEGEISKSVIGLTHIWILKSFLVALFGLLLLAAISQLIKAVAGLRGELPDEMVSGALGGDN
ncbi:MAG: TRAP transporter small permease subunit [Pseudomonadota bacterium]|nr:TRAP transporter small permease subunit [Pseudomonadota bacterium]